jgi:hypothetical protein
MTGGFLLRADGDCGAEIDRAVVSGGAVDLGELVLGAGEADFQALDLAEPAFALGLGDAVEEVAADLGDAGPLGGVGPVHAAPQAAMLMNARSAESAPAYPGRDFPELEVIEEFLPFLIAGNPVFIGRSLRPPPGKERQVRLDGLFRVKARPPRPATGPVHQPRLAMEGGVPHLLAPALRTARTSLTSTKPGCLKAWPAAPSRDLDHAIESRKRAGYRKSSLA